MRSWAPVNGELQNAINHQQYWLFADPIILETQKGTHKHTHTHTEGDIVLISHANTTPVPCV